MLQVKLNRRPAEKNFSDWVDNFMTEMPAFFKSGFNGFETKSWAPVNVKETADSYRMEVIAPGFDKNDFKIDLEKDLLTISAGKQEEKKEKEDENEKEIRREYSYRSFKRIFTIGEKIDATRIAATYINGVLQLNLPKKQEVKAAVTEISVK
jgi:HSP20 family protein